jgi:hypothetical protein
MLRVDDISGSGIIAIPDPLGLLDESLEFARRQDSWFFLGRDKAGDS